MFFGFWCKCVGNVGQFASSFIFFSLFINIYIWTIQEINPFTAIIPISCRIKNLVSKLHNTLHWQMHFKHVTVTNWLDCVLLLILFYNKIHLSNSLSLARSRSLSHPAIAISNVLWGVWLFSSLKRVRIFLHVWLIRYYLQQEQV